MTSPEVLAERAKWLEAIAQCQVSSNMRIIETVEWIEKRATDSETEKDIVKIHEECAGVIVNRYDELSKRVIE